MSCSFDYLIQPACIEKLHKPGVIVFQSSSYPLLFFALLRTLWLKKNSIKTDPVDFTADNNNLKALFATSFLGDSSTYWLGNLTALESSELSTWCNYLQQYTGPHNLIVFCEDSQKFITTDWLTLHAIPATISLQQYTELAQLINLTPNATFAQHIFSRYPTITLDQACLLLQYQQVTGKSSGQFFKDWLELLIPEKRSLFSLSQAFFAKQPKAFFQLLLKINTDYPIEFWVAYWSEQLWQAIIFIGYAQAGNILEGKKHVTRLPFSFTQKDWRLSTIQELTNAHEFLMHLDYLVKNGGADYGLEIFYAKFLSNQFTNYTK